MAGTAVGGLQIDAVNRGGDSMTGNLILNTLNSANISADKTVDATDCGIIQNVTVDAKVITLPATVVGLTYTIRNGGENGTVLVAVSPNASDKISGLGFTATDNKDALNTKLTAKKGDYIKLIGDGLIGWYVIEAVGTWARE